jgi:putative nucleotidyltransferase with HDIG domain
MDGAVYLLCSGRDPLKSLTERPLPEDMRNPRHVPASEDDRCGLVRSLLAQSLERGTFVVPRLPEAAVRIVELRENANAQQLSAVIKADPALTMYILRIAASAPNRAAMPIVSLTHAVAWLGLDEVANMAFTLALQPKMLDVPGQQRKARRLWRHSLASALWSRQLALALEREPGLCYLCGLLHDIGKAVTLREAHELARWSGTLLESSDYDRIVDEFHREVAACVVTTWGMPEAIVAVATRWGAPCGAARFECGIVNAARSLADCTAQGAALPTLQRLAEDAAFRELGLRAEAAASILECDRAVNAELDRYLSP